MLGQSNFAPRPAAHGMPRQTRTGATVSRARDRPRIDAGPIKRRFCSAVSGEQGKERFCGSLRVRGSASGQAQKPIQSPLGWETGRRSQHPKTPIQNAFGWWMGLDGNGWAVRPAVTIAPAGKMAPMAYGHDTRFVALCLQCRSAVSAVWAAEKGGNRPLPSTTPPGCTRIVKYY